MLLFFQWESFKAALNISSKPVKVPKSDVKVKPGSKSGDAIDSTGASRIDEFNVLNHSTQTLAEQLTLIEQVRVTGST